MLKITTDKIVSKAIGSGKMILDPSKEYTQENLQALRKYFPDVIRQEKLSELREQPIPVDVVSQGTLGTLDEIQKAHDEFISEMKKPAPKKRAPRKKK